MKHWREDLSPSLGSALKIMKMKKSDLHFFLPYNYLRKIKRIFSINTDRCDECTSIVQISRAYNFLIDFFPVERQNSTPKWETAGEFRGVAFHTLYLPQPMRYSLGTSPDTLAIVRRFDFTTSTKKIFTSGWATQQRSRHWRNVRKSY